MTARDVYNKGNNKLLEALEIECTTDCLLLLEHTCKVDRNVLLSHPEREIDEALVNEFFKCIDKRIQGYPVQYITGQTSFMGLEFLVDTSTLIPRFDTECLVEEVLKELHDGMNILDMCTGSGCILLSLLHYSNNCKGTGVDISKAAIELAKKNMNRLQLQADFAVSDMFENVNGKYDIIVSNPPYINSDVIKTLDVTVREHEPMSALDGGTDGMMFYRIILKEAKEYLLRNGMLFLEIGYDQGERIMDLLIKEGYKQPEIIQDLAGNDRVAKAYFY